MGPDDWTHDDVVNLLDQKGLKGRYNFIYVPMNFRKMANFGYAFVNLESTSTAEELMEKLAEHEDEELRTDWSSKQGRDENIEYFRNNSVMHKSVRDDWKPALYDTEGNRISFPEPTKRIAKPRVHWNKAEKSPHSED